jgi:hypothetical protein
LRISNTLLSRRRLWPGCAFASVPEAATTRAITWNNGTVQAQPPTRLKCETVPSFAEPLDELPGDTKIPPVFTDAVHQVLLEELRQVGIVAHWMKINLSHLDARLF